MQQIERIYNFDMMLRYLRRAKRVFVAIKVITDEVDYIEVKGAKNEIRELIKKYRDHSEVRVTPMFDWCEVTQEVWIG